MVHLLLVCAVWAGPADAPPDRPVVVSAQTPAPAAAPAPPAPPAPPDPTEYARDLLAVSEVVIGLAGTMFGGFTLLIAVAAILGVREFRQLAAMRREIHAIQAAQREELDQIREVSTNLTAEFGGLAERLRQDARLLLQSTYFYNEANREHQHGNHEAAIALFRRVVRLRPEDPMPHYRMARAFTYQGKMLEAREALAKAKKLDPEMPEVEYALAITYRYEELPRAIELIQQAIAKAPKNPEFLNYLGYLRAQNGQYEEAHDAHRRAHAASPQADSAMNVVLMLRAAGKDEDVSDLVDYVETMSRSDIREGDRPIWALFRLWWVCVHRGDLDGAERELRAALDYKLSDRHRKVIAEQIDFICGLYGAEGRRSDYLAILRGRAFLEPT